MNGQVVEVKRVIDVAAALVGLCVLAPLLLLVAVVIRLTLGSPVLFAQKRPGLYGRPFRMLKFRTMRDARDAHGHPLPDGERLTPLGRFLRWTSLDELPELINVLKGDMSFVGPRPLLMEYLPLYSERQARRHEVRPGVTGLAQISGRNTLSWEEKFDMDVWYVENRTLWLDLRILVWTLVHVAKQEGVAQPGHPTVERFRGNRHEAAL